MFAAVLPISVTQALAADGDAEAWAASGGEAFSEALLEAITGIQRKLRLAGVVAAPRPVPDLEDEPAPEPVFVQTPDPATADFAPDPVDDDQVEPEAEPIPGPAPAHDPAPTRLRVVHDGQPDRVSDSAETPGLRVVPRPAAPAMPRRVPRPASGEAGARPIRPTS
jgi:hypothetical protein